MLPPEIADYISQPGLAMSFGTRDASLQTSVSHAYAVKISDDRKSVRFMFPKIVAGNHIENMKHNGRIAFTIGHPVTHVCYQLKGKYINHADCSQEDLEHIGKSFAAFEEVMVNIFGDQVRESFRKMNFGEFMSVTFSPEEIFDQTPGPGAGKKLT